ncbi:hypothetical protein D8674_034001 [Pyrus ussuriensis x Pyrus communis]|uniref:Uncharacterized protein n=1 Tax=Pyrus ussuriensis x Pyrus communis TaxID=2448454 RepID=A0A5N5HMM7_9ROSA|nr:hypothetical protein D8674_034001 [Pyrus ussuriensis x Pyrus communis]
MAKQIFYLDDPKGGSGLYDILELDHDENDNNKKYVASKKARESKTLLHHFGSMPFSNRVEARCQGSKLPELDMFKDVYVRPDEEIVKQLHDTGLQILTETLDQTLGHHHGKVVRGMGKVLVRETGAFFFRPTTGQVIALTEEVATLKDKIVAQKAQITAQETQIATQDEKMSMILWAFQLSGLKILMPTPYLAPLSTSQLLRPADTQ